MKNLSSNFFKNIVTKLKFNVAQRNIENNRKYCTNFQERKIAINNATINYLKIGNGDKSILCFPGAMGTIWSDFKPQITKLNKDTYTIVAFDPPGYGQSRPPMRKFTDSFYKDDAIVAHALMKMLDIHKFSLLGWSDGGISSIILAANFPNSVEKLVVWGSNSYLLSEDISAFEKIRNVKKWSEKAREPLVELYGEDGLQEMWSGWCDTQISLQKKGGNICMDAVAKITCPTLILHGKKDPIVLHEHPKYLHANIRDSRLHIFPNGKHNIHLRYSDEFNSIVSEFLNE